MALEVEARFRADDRGSLGTLATTPTLGQAELGPAEVVDELDRYLDTDDGRLATARWACRLRTRHGMTRLSLKGPAAGDTGAAWLHRRPEMEGPATDALDPAAWPPSEARDRLAELAGDRPLHERFRLAQRRTERAVALGGRALGTLTLDAVRFLGPDGRDLGTLDTVELELAMDDDGRPRAAAETALGRLADALAALPGLVPEPRTKLEHALARLAGG
jgi:inorganic triphosphatase YgiF